MHQTTPILKINTVFTLLLCATIGSLYALAAPMLTYHNDIGWHLAAGRYMATHATIPTSDPWSITAGETPWINLSWGWDIVAYYLFRAGEIFALLCMVILCMIASFLLLSRIALQMGARPVIILGISILSALAFPTYAPPDIFLSVSPQIVTLIFSTLLLWLLGNRECKPTHVIVLISLLFILWCNLHGGFLLGLAILGFHTASAVLHKHWLTARNTIIAGILASIITLFVTPYGTSIIQGTLGTIGHFSQKSISEWMPLSMGFSFATGWPALLYTALFIAAMSQIKPLWRHSVLSGCLIFTSLFLAVMGWMQLRYFALFIVFSLPLTCAGLSLFLHAKERPNTLLQYAIDKRRFFRLSLIILSFILAMTLSSTPPQFLAEGASHPADAIGFIERDSLQPRIMNHWNFGSFIVLRGNDEFHHFIDGRSATAFSDQVIYDYEQFELGSPEQAKTVLDAYKIDYVLWNNYHENIAKKMRTLGWDLVFEGATANVWKRPQAP